MKIAFYIFCFIFTSYSFGQYSNDINTFRKETSTSITLPKQYKQETNQTKDRFLRREYNDTNSILCQGKLHNEDFKDFRSRYDTALYVHDFDADGDYDILFYGRLCPGYNNTDAVIFFKQGKNYIPMQLGNWIVKMDLTRKTTELAVMKTPGIADYQLEFMYYENVKGIEDSLVQYTHQVFGLDDLEIQHTAIDTTLSIKKALQVVLAPDLTAERYSEFIETGGNPIIGKLVPGISLRAYNSYVFDNKTWYYIIANVNMEIILNEEWKHSHFGEIKSVRGWICLEQ